MALRTRPDVLPAIPKPKATPNATLNQEDWADKLAKIIAARRARQEMRKGKPPVLSKTWKVKL